MKSIMLRRAMASFFVFLLGGLGAVADVTSENGSLFDPNAATEVNDAVTVANGESITFNTDDLAIGGDYSGDGEQAISESGNVTLAMFTFKGLTIEEGATVTVTGSRGLVLASRKDMTIEANVILDLQGEEGEMAGGGAGGPGGYAGGYNRSAGSGPGGGGGGGTSWSGYGGGGGGGYGGDGGDGSYTGSS